ncbi:PaaI family thioesterase [Desulfovibrio cuneatus]|uniref:PaaI family thioesterase n=1 Tax=Desulfovibrio cuneatus TaxID=159728 RepID=UPI000485043A|nr:hotdog fold thioesterase [Desulfovibrio cuneatus]
MKHEQFVSALNQQSQGTLMQSLGIVFTKADENCLHATMPVDARTCQPFGKLHGGATIALAETIAGAGSLLLCAKDARCVGMQVSASHMHSASMGETVEARATLLHKGKSSHVWNVDVYSLQTDKLISSVRVTNAIIPSKAVPYGG